MKLRLHFLLIFLLAFGFCFLNAQTTKSIKPNTKRTIDSTYNSLLKKFKAVGLSLAIVDSGRVVYSMGYGFADLENKRAASDKSIYRIGSCTKSFTSLSILQLQEKNKLSVDQSIKKYLPELSISSRFMDNNNFFINDMMCHVSGMPCDVLNGFFCDAPPDMNWLIAELNRQESISPRRYKPAYSNVAYSLLGEVVARQGNTTYSAYVKENIFDPLEMKSSFIEWDSLLVHEFAKGYLGKKLVKEPLIRDQAAGLIHSNVLDMSNYLIMFLNKGQFGNKHILSPDGIEEMCRNQVKDLDLSEDQNWGYGLYTTEAISRKEKDSSHVNIVGHGGDTYAYHSDFGFIPELGVGAVVLTNSDNGAAIRSAIKLLKIYLKAERGIVLNTKYVYPKDSSLTAPGERPCTAKEKIGYYNFNSMLAPVKRPNKISFRQGPARIIMKLKENDTVNYKLRAVVFGIIPVKIKDQEFLFVNRNGKIYAKVKFTASGKQEYIGPRSEHTFIPEAWKSAIGRYRVVNKVYSCKDCPFMNLEGIELKLKEEHGFLVLQTKAKSKDTRRKAYLELIHAKLAVTGGIGRGTGETLRILDNGNLYYNGFVFTKVN